MVSKVELTKGQKVGLMLLGVGLVVVGVMGVQLRREWQRLRQRRLEVKQQGDRLKVIEELAGERLVWGGRFEELVKFFPESEEEVAGVAGKLEELAEDAGLGLRLTFEDFAEEVEVGNQKQLGLGLNAEVKGSYQGVVKWVREVQQLAYFVRLVEVKIGAMEDGSGVKANFKGELFLSRR